MSRFHIPYGSRRTTSGGWGGIPSVFTGGAKKVIHKARATRPLAEAAKAKHNAGSAWAYRRAKKDGSTERWKNKAFLRLREKIKARNDGQTKVSLLQKVSERISVLMEKAYRLEAIGQAARFAEFMGSDIAGLVADACAFALSQMGDFMFEEYAENLVNTWFMNETTMNNGQITITEVHYLPEIEFWLAEQVAPEDGEGGTKWPTKTRTAEYADYVAAAYEQDVWERAFTDTTDDPIESCEEIRKAAVQMKKMADAIGGFFV